QKAERIVTESITRAELSGHALTGRVASEASVLLKSLEISLGNELDKRVKDLEEDKRDILSKLTDTVDLLDGSLERAYEEKEAAVVDIAERLGQTLLAKSEVFIQSIRGTAQLQGTAHTLTVIGSGLGPGKAGRVTELKLFIGGEEIKPDFVDPSQSN